MPEALKDDGSPDKPDSNEGIAGARAGAAFFAPALGAAFGFDGMEASSSARRRSRSAFLAARANTRRATQPAARPFPKVGQAYSPRAASAAAALSSFALLPLLSARVVPMGQRTCHLREFTSGETANSRSL